MPPHQVPVASATSVRRGLRKCDGSRWWHKMIGDSGSTQQRISRPGSKRHYTAPSPLATWRAGLLIVVSWSCSPNLALGQSASPRTERSCCVTRRLAARSHGKLSMKKVQGRHICRGRSTLRGFGSGVQEVILRSARRRIGNRTSMWPTCPMFPVRARARDGSSANVPKPPAPSRAPGGGLRPARLGAPRWASRPCTRRANGLVLHR